MTVAEIQFGKDNGFAILTKEQFLSLFENLNIVWYGLENWGRYEKEELEKHNLFIEFRYKDDAPRTKKGTITNKQYNKLINHKIIVHDLNHDFSHLY